MLQKFKELFKRKKEIVQEPDAYDPVPALQEEPKPKKDFFGKMVSYFTTTATNLRKIKHRRRGDRHGLSLRETRKMGVAE